MACGKEDKGKVMTFVVRGRVNEKDKIMIFSHCKRSGHDTNSCFTLIGYPSGRVIDRVLMKKVEAMVGDHNSRYNMIKTK